MAGVVTVDDSQSNIVYSAGQWQRRNARNPNIFDGTLTMTSSVGATATLAFEGTGITVMGVVLADGTPPTSAYVLDDGNPVMFIAQPARQNQLGVVFFRSPPLPFGVHQLTIINANSQRGSSPFILDSFTINTGPATPAPVPPSPNPPALPSAPASSPSAIATPSPSLSTDSTSTPVTSTTPLTTLPAQASPTVSDLPPVIVTVTSQRSPAGSATPSVGANGALSGADNRNGADGEKSGGGSNAGAIAGGIVAAIVGIGLLVVAFVFWRRRQRSRSRGGPQPLRRGHSSFWDKPAPANPSGSPPITPFVLDSELPSQRRPAPPPPQMSQYQSQASPYGQSDPYSRPYQFTAPPSQNIPPPIIANNRFSYADSMYTDGPGAREGEVDPYGGYTSATPAPPVPTSSSARPILATPNPFYPQAVNTSVPTPSSEYGQSPFNNPPAQQQQPTRLQYNPAPQATSQYVPPSQLLNARLQGGGSGSGFDSYGRGMPVPTSDPSYMYASQSQGKRERIRLD